MYIKKGADLSAPLFFVACFYSLLPIPYLWPGIIGDCSGGSLNCSVRSLY